MNYQLEQWLIEPKQLRISRGAERKQMEPRVMAVLIALIEAAPEPMSREALEAAVWGDVHVSETLVRRAISTLRTALGDNARRPRYIQTIPRMGYAVIPIPIRMDDQTLQARTNPAFHHLEQAEAQRLKLLNQRNRLLGLGLSLVLLVALVVRLATLEHRQVAPPAVLNVPAGGYLLSPGIAKATRPAMRRDGSEKVFVGPMGTGEELFRWDEGYGGKARALTSDGGAKVGPSFSPDGAYLAYGVVKPMGKCAVRVLHWGYRTRTVFEGMGRLLDVVWLDKNRLLVSFAKADPVTGEFGAFHIGTLDFDPDVDDDQPAQLIEPTPITWPMSAYVGDLLPTPDDRGRHLAFVRELSAGVGDIFLRDGELPERKLTQLRGRFGGLDWDDGGDWLYFSIFENGRYTLNRVSPISGAVEHVPFNYPVRRFVVAGNHLLFEHYREVTEIHRGPIQHDGPPVPFIAGDAWDSMPAWSNGGDRIAFVSTREGNRDLWVVGADGYNLRRLTSWGGAMVLNPNWSADDQHIAFEVREGESGHIYQMDVAKAIPVQMTRGQVLDALPYFGTEGRWLYYARRRETLDWEIRRVRLDGSRDEVLTEPPAGGYHLEASGSQYVVTGPSAGVVFAMSGDGQLKELFAGTGLDVTNWTIRGSRLYYLMRSNSGISLMQYDLALHRVAKIRELPGYPTPYGLAVSPTESHYLFTQQSGFRADILVMPLGF